MDLQQKVDLTQLIKEASELEASGVFTPKYEALLKEICERDPINSQFVSQYAELLVQKRVQPLENSVDENLQIKGNEVEEAQKIFERSLRYNSANVALWQSYL